MKFKFKYHLSTYASTHVKVFYQKYNDNPQKSFKLFKLFTCVNVRQIIAAYFKKVIFPSKQTAKTGQTIVSN